MNSLSKAYHALRRLGPSFAGRRLILATRHRLGVTRRVFGPRPWPSIQLADILSSYVPSDLVDYVAYKQAHLPRFLFPLGKPPSIGASAAPEGFERTPPLRERLQLLEQDRCVYFLHRPSPEAIDWYHNPFDDTLGEAHRVWCDIPDFLETQGDPRVLWEPSRAAWAMDCARARARGLDWPAAPVFWRWVDSWMAACPPFNGFQWKCGQEASVRLIAMATAFWALAADAQTVDEHWLKIARLAWATGYRVRRHIEYAVSQNNNHALSEGCGLMLVAHLFPEFAAAREWGEKGRRVFEERIRRQVYPDGSYIQHSMNYHRVMLHVAVMAMRLAELADSPFGRDVYQRVERAAEFIHQMSDPESGRTPHYGNDDGACVLPLTECDAGDYRPVVQSAHYLVHRARLLQAGPWDEEMVWLFGEEATSSPPCHQHPWKAVQFTAGGYYKLHRGTTWAMIRCHDYGDRPGQCDSMHVDLWWQGTNVLRDCGTFLYYCPQAPALEKYFASRRAHNTVEVDGQEGISWITRFLFVPFPKARCTRFLSRTDEGVGVFEGESYDYQRRPWRVLHHRAVVAVSEELWIVVDDFIGSGEHSCALRWHFAAEACELSDGGVRLSTPSGPMFLHVVGRDNGPQLSLQEGISKGPRPAGIAAPYYSTVTPIPTLTIESRCALPVRMITAIGLGEPITLRPVGASGETENWEVARGSALLELQLRRTARNGEVYLRAQRRERVAAVAEGMQRYVTE